MTSRRKWDRGVYAGLALYCALLLCAGPVRAEGAARTSVAANKSPAVTSPSTTDSLKAKAVGDRGDSGDKSAAGPAAKADIPSSEALKRSSSDFEKDLIDGKTPKTKSGDDFAWPSLLAPLAVVLVVIILVFWAVRKYVPGMRRFAGSSVVRVLARTYLSPRQSVTLVKVGRRILVVGQTADRLSRLAEIGDGEEVSELLGLCRSEGGQSISRSFQKIFREADREYDEKDGGSGAVDESPEQLGRVRSQLDDLARKVRHAAGRKR